MNDKRNTQDELAQQVIDMSGVNGSNRQVILAISKQILSNARLEEAIVNFSKSTKNTEKEMRDLAKASVKLAKAQVWLAVAAIVAAIILAKAFGN